MIAITVCATKSYCYALFAQARRVQGAIAREPEGVVILAGDQSEEFRAGVRAYQEAMPQGWNVVSLELAGLEERENYQEQAQLVIAQLRTAAFTRARKLGVERCWSLDSDVLPQANALRCMQAMLDFDDGYYGISTCPYPSQGGTMFLGGRGTPQRPILPDVYEDERDLPEELVAELKAHRENHPNVGGPNRPSLEEWMAVDKELRKKVEAIAPRGKNVFGIQSQGWRRRGWMDFAYPGIGRGAVLPTDWCGFGCTLMGREALALAQFDGYDGKGTEDLYVVWKRWHRAGLRINVITHSPCDHVIRRRGAPGYVLQQVYHEDGGELEGHLRIESRPWYEATPGERWTKENDGRLHRPTQEKP